MIGAALECADSQPVGPNIVHSSIEFFGSQPVEIEAGAPVDVDLKRIEARLRSELYDLG